LEKPSAHRRHRDSSSRKTSNDAVFAAWFTLNGNGEMTGTTWVDDSDSSMAGHDHQHAQRWRGPRRVIAWKANTIARRGRLLVVASRRRRNLGRYLNDINGFHVKPEDAWHALEAAHAGPVEEGNVGGGTGMICNEFKAESEPVRACSTPNWAVTPSACSSSATTDRASNSALPA